MSRSTLHPLRRLSVAAVATIASAVAVAPGAVAADDDTTDGPTTEATTPEPAAPEPADEPKAEDPAPEPAEEPKAEEPDPEPAAAVVQDSGEVGAEEGTDDAQRVAAADDAEFVDRPIRVTVDFAGTPSPETLETAGTKITVVVTDADRNKVFHPCTTVPIGSSRRSQCLFSDGASTTLTVPAGSTVEATIDDAAWQVRGDRTMTAEPTIDPEGQTLQFLLEAPGPQAATDSAETDQGEPITIDVADNDENVVEGATVVLDENTPPQNGTVELVDGGSKGTQQIVYTPDEDYVGSDEFGYLLQTPDGGSSFALVQIQVNAVQDIEPNFGEQKYRVAVDIDPDAYVPAGTTTVGSTFTIVTTAADGTTTTATCTTVPGGFFFPGGPLPDGLAVGTGSACPGDNGIPIPGLFDFYVAPPGATVTVTQTSVPEDEPLTRDERVQVLEPCEIGDAGCGFIFNTSPRTLQFEDGGTILPDPQDDTAATDADTAVTIDVLANDTDEDPDPPKLSIDEGPGHGTATVVGSGAPVVDPGPVLPMDLTARPALANAGTLAVEYTPEDGFSGIDTFTYALGNSNGAATATVSVTVREGEVVEPDPDDTDDDSDVSDKAATTARPPSSNARLPQTGGLDAGWLGLGGLLVATGGAIAARGRTGDSID